LTVLPQAETKEGKLFVHFPSSPLQPALSISNVFLSY